MHLLTTLDKFGRILIPKKFRERLGISSDTIVNIVEDGERIIIEPVKDQAPLVKKDGLLIFTGKFQGDLGQVLRVNRSKRINKVFLSDD